MLMYYCPLPLPTTVCSLRPKLKLTTLAEKCWLKFLVQFSTVQHGISIMALKQFRLKHLL